MTKPRNRGGFDWSMEKNRISEKLKRYKHQDSVIYETGTMRLEEEFRMIQPSRFPMLQ